MNIELWHHIRSYMDASIELATLRLAPLHTNEAEHLQKIRHLEERIRDEEAKVRCKIAAFEKRLVSNGVTELFHRCPFRTAGGDHCILTENHGGMHVIK